MAVGTEMVAAIRPPCVTVMTTVKYPVNVVLATAAMVIAALGHVKSTMGVVIETQTAFTRYCCFCLPNFQLQKFA